MLEEGGSYTAYELLMMPVSVFEESRHIRSLYVDFNNTTQETSGKEMHLTRILWKLYNQFPVFKLNLEHTYAYHRNHYSSGTMDTILNDILWSSYDLSVAEGYQPDMVPLTKYIYDLADETYEVYRHQGNHVQSICITDFIDIHDDPKLRKSLDDIWAKPIEQVDEHDISTCYEAVSNAVNKERRLAAVPTAMAARCSAVKIGQLYKCEAPYGFITDVDSHRFRLPVLNSLLTGLIRIEDTVRESRTASMSIYYQQDAMRKSEYTTRRIQGGAAIISRVHRNTDCRTKRYTTFLMPENHLRDLVGIPYLDDDGVERNIRKNDRHLLGKFIKMRTIFGCEIGDRYGFCEKCYGELAKSLMPGDNIGYIAATSLQEIITQNILSQKHLTASAIIGIYTFEGSDKQFLQNRVGKTGFWVNPALKNKGKVTMVFNEKDAQKIQDINFISDLSGINPSQLTKLTGVKFQVFKDDVMQYDYYLRTSTESRSAYLTIDALKYIKRHKWKLDPAGNYIVDLDKWDYDLAIMDMPMIQYSTPALMMASTQFLISGRDSGAVSVPTFTNPMDAARNFFELIRPKVSVNFIHIQVLMAMYLAEDPDNFDYRVPKYKYQGQIVDYNSIMLNRDSSLAMSYEDHNLGFFSKLDSYLVKKRHPHPMNKMLS